MSDHPLTHIRQLLANTPTTNQWWELVQHLDSLESGRQLCVEYVREHLKQNPAWQRTAVTKEDWPEESLGWNLSQTPWLQHENAPFYAELYCPPGSFLMGAPEDDRFAYKQEKPQREVSINRGFWLFPTPVTQELYFAVTDEMAVEPYQARHPVVEVSWNEAVGFCNALSRLKGLEEAYRVDGDSIHWKGLECEGYRLPMEAEWEYACRAGSTTQTYFGQLDDMGSLFERDYRGAVEYSEVLELVAWYEEITQELKEVGLNLPNRWGFYDQLGNVWEWCQDIFDPNSEHNDERTIRGGSWNDLAHMARASTRMGLLPYLRNVTVGFRVARTARDEDFGG